MSEISSSMGRAPAALDEFFGAARAAVPEAGDEFLARVYADAEALTGRRAAALTDMRAADPGAVNRRGIEMRPDAARRRSGAFARAAAVLRGRLPAWGGLGGLAVAGVAGFCIGFVGVDSSAVQAALTRTAMTQAAATEEASADAPALLNDGDILAFALQ